MSERYRTDCRRCKGLCCIVPAHIPDNGFPADKPTNQPCRHLGADHRCGIFESLETEGFMVCRAYDCHGAGPLVSRWIEADAEAAPRVERYEDFRQLSRLHLLAMAVRGEDQNAGSDATCLFDALDVISIIYARNGVFAMTKIASDALARNEEIVVAVLDRLGRR